ncbi:MAG: NAD-dependent dihydropyrimidine dehydrogenase subunit PreA [Planctomycetota bacterium]|jgi:dihydropyrimidine dehydrogenase (NADP+)/dihydropyrimidine dehydrogenase (NAD+) subunit PreA
MVDLSITVDGLKMPNPFVIGSGPPGTNANVIGRAFDEGWGAVVAKTISLDASKVINVAPRYARVRAAETREVIGWENIELISDRPFETWIDEFKSLKDKYPDRVLVASIMEEYRRDAWVEIVERCEATGVDAFELNFSCPHGLPERKMGSAMGQDPEMLTEVCGWVNETATIPVWAKMTPNITSIVDPARASLQAGCEGISAINTILSVMNVNLDTLRPEPTVEGYTVPGGYSGKAIRPIALRMIMELGTMMYGGGCGAPIPDDDEPPGRGEFPDRSLSAIGGVESGEDAAQYLLLGAHTVQVCTGVMIHGYKLLGALVQSLTAFMEKHDFDRVEDFRGRSLRYFTTHAELVRRQAQVKATQRAAKAGMVTQDTAWEGDRFVEQSDRLVANE